MDVTNYISIISSVGFPIFMCLVMMYYIKYREDKNTETTNALNLAHTEEMLKFKDDMTKALNNNTIALEKLCEKLNERGEIK